MKFRVTIDDAVRTFLRFRCNQTEPGTVGDMTKLVKEFCRQSAEMCLNKAKDDYRELHSGGCGMFSEGDSCDCFLCRCDNLLFEIEKERKNES